MGTSTIYKKMNDIAIPLSKINKRELKKIDNLSPYSKEKETISGWSCPMELHNGNVNILVWWRGRLMRLEDSPGQLNNKYYNRYSGKTLREYEWTILRRMILREVEYLDKNFKKEIRRNKNNL